MTFQTLRELSFERLSLSFFPWPFGTLLIVLENQQGGLKWQEMSKLLDRLERLEDKEARAKFCCGFPLPYQITQKSTLKE